ncbi:hypothetical protein F5Y17DRAFT_452921 [Xylariaceae sp. FL0594]|nr:hypothetical protein F5Y17DRAFT_452921 [Xylariaceae sp. FL0594]
MSFGSTQATSKSQTSLQLQWNCDGKGGASRKLVDFWVEQTNTTWNTHRGDWVLTKDEHEDAVELLQKDPSFVRQKVEALLQMKMALFTRTRNQILSFLIAWEQIILEKQRYDEEGLHPSNNPDDLSPHQFLILFQIVWGRARVGLADLTPNLTNSTALTGIKRSIESASPPPAKGQGDDGSSTKRVRLDE